MVFRMPNSSHSHNHSHSHSQNLYTVKPIPIVYYSENSFLFPPIPNPLPAKSFSIQNMQFKVPDNVNVNRESSLHRPIHNVA